jgi:hypothetical protein
MNKHICFSVISGILATTPVFAQAYKEVYPFRPISAEEIKTKAIRLSEDTNALTNIFELERQGLTKANAKNQPWSGPYWSLKQGMIANPYQDRTIFQYLQYIPTFDDIKPYDKRRNYIMTTEAQMTEEELAKLAPSEKYDLLLGNQLDLTNRIWDFINKWKNDMKWDFITSIDLPDQNFEIEKKNYIVANWEGICHGWAPASGVVPKPVKTVVVTLPDGRRMPFYPEDIKGLVSLTWANSLVQDNVISEGLRCKRREPKRDKYGRYYDDIPENGVILPRCADVHPAVMHVTLANVTGKQGRSFVIDKNNKIAVSNQPVNGYEFKYFDVSDGEDKSFDYAIIPYAKYRAFDPFAESRHPNTKFIIGVEATIIYADWTQVRNPDRSNYLKDETGELVSLYDLEIDATGNIIGGQWRGMKDLSLVDDEEFQNSSSRLPSMVTVHPDFLWVVPKNYKSYFKALPLEDWDIRSGTHAPASWTKASIAAHSFKYENTKYFGNNEMCKVKNKETGIVTEVACEFKYPKPQPLIQVVDQLIDFSKR